MKSIYRFVSVFVVAVLLCCLFCFSASAASYENFVYRWSLDQGIPFYAEQMPYGIGFNYQEWIESTNILDNWHQWYNAELGYNQYYWQNSQYNADEVGNVFGVDVVLEDEYLYLQEGNIYNFRFALGRPGGQGTEWDIGVELVGVLFGCFLTNDYYYIAAKPDLSDANYVTELYIDVYGVKDIERIDTVMYMYQYPDGNTYPRIMCSEYIYVEYVPETEYVVGEIGSSIDHQTEQLKAEIQTSTDQIVAEVTASSEQISSSIDEQTDILVNGWDPDPVKPEGSGTVDDYTEKESQLLLEQQASIEAGTSMITDLGSVLSQYGNGLGFVSLMLTDLMSFDWLNALITISLSLGIGGFLLNLGRSGGSSKSSRRSSNNEKQEKKEDKGAGDG